MDRPRKRPRPTLSCRECRAKKLRCDRAQPCQQCVKSEREDQCGYDSGIGPASPISLSPATRPRSADPAPPPLPGVIEDLQARVAALETIIRSGGSHASASQAQGEISTNQSQHQNQRRSHAQKPVGTLSVKGERCRYYGHDYQCGFFDRVRDFAVSMLQPSADVELWELAKEVQGLCKRLIIETNEAPLSPQEPLLTSDAALARMRETMPEKAVCDSLLGTYFSMFEERLVILHKPSFTPLYEAYVENRDQSLSDRVIPQMHAAMALAAYQVRNLSSIHQVAVKRWLQTSPYATAETWLDRLPRRSRGEIRTLQTQALLVLSGKSRRLPIEEHWQETNALVRSAMTLGLHRRPEELHGFPPLQANLRRELWRSIVEMDVQASIRYGMPPAVRAEDTDCLDAAGARVGLVISSISPMLQGTVSYSLRSRLDIANTICRPLDPSSRTTVSQLLDDIDDTMSQFGGLPNLNMGRLPDGPYFSLISHTLQHDALRMSARRALSTEADLDDAALRAAHVSLAALDEVASRSQEDPSFRPFQDLFHAEFMHDVLKAVAVISIHLDANIDASSVDSVGFNAAQTVSVLDKSLRAIIDNAASEAGNLKNILALSISIDLAEARCTGTDERNSIRKGLMKTLTTLRGVLLGETEVRMLYV